MLLGSKMGRELAGEAVKIGGMAVIGGLAYKAYSDWQAKQAGQSRAAPAMPAQLPPPPTNSPFMPKGDEAENRARLLVTAMISAAKADGYIDQAEQEQIFGRLDSAASTRNRRPM